MKTKQTCTKLALAFGGMLALSAAHAHSDHQHDDHEHNHQDNMESMSQMQGMFLEKRDIDGYTVSFHVMAAEEGMHHGGSHNFMVKIEQGGKVVSRVAVNSKVIFPDGKSTTKPLMKMGDWFMAGYDLGQPGRHQLMVLFRTADGSKHGGGVYYPHK